MAGLKKGTRAIGTAPKGARGLLATLTGRTTRGRVTSAEKASGLKQRRRKRK